jgi:valyl-tRNA synthetase
MITMEMAKAYEPQPVEAKRYADWLQRGLFGAVPGKGTPYCITIPPPNITGSLHCGHALNNSIMDCLIRWRRMSGDNTLCLPGTDHAGIATQAVVERQLASEGLSRHDLGREAFVERCWAWRRQYGDRIIMQLQRLGCSYDWSRTRFTLDESYVEAIYEEFLRWWDRGLIYRGARVVNWCPRCSSAISDIEVSPEERPGALYHIRYPLADGSGHVVVATTRPETMLGDTAVAVNPEDERYRHLIGTRVRLPLTDRTIPIVADSYARMDFGTGAVKVTPAHDLDDFEAGLRNNLAQIRVIGEDGCMTTEAGPAYAGLDRFECRDRVIRDLTDQGLLAGTEPYTIKVPLCERCKTVLEPLLSEQWFVKQHELAKPAIEAVESGRIRFHPQRYARIYLEWMRNIRDWCISRQLWWGHRIPVWWTRDGRYEAGRNAEEAARRLGVNVEDITQDEDVLDTWFSSALWPHATLGWPRDTDDLRFWYPTSLLSTAQEIIYLWVARMIMTGLDFLGEIPFRDVYIHATVLDGNGERMSKSKGNGVDPLDMIEQYGADALRFSLLQQAGRNQDFRFMEERVRLARSFNNKLWNAARFVIGGLDNADGDERCRLLDLIKHGSPPSDVLERTDLWDRWILSRLQAAIRATDTGLRHYDMDDAARALYTFVWDEFCDWYLEVAKGRLRDDAQGVRTRMTLVHVLDTALRLLHPMVPHITEEIWDALHTALGAVEGERRSLMVAAFPQASDDLVSDAAESRVGFLMEVVRGIRNVRAEFGMAPGLRLNACAVPGSPEQGQVLSDNAAVIEGLARLSRLSIADARPSAEDGWASVSTHGAEVCVDIGSAIDLATERQRLDKDIAVTEAEIARSSQRLGNPQFVEKAPAAVVEKERQLLAEHQEKMVRLREKLQAIASLMAKAATAKDEG